MGTFSNPGFDVDPPAFDSPMQVDVIAMSPTSSQYQSDMVSADNPLYADSNSQEIHFTEKPTKKPSPQNVYEVSGNENVYDQPGFDHPGYERPGLKHPGYEEPKQAGSEKPRYETLFQEKPAYEQASYNQFTGYDTYPSDEARYEKPRDESPFKLPGDPDYDNPTNAHLGNMKKWENFDNVSEIDQEGAGASGTLELQGDKMDDETIA